MASETAPATMAPQAADPGGAGRLVSLDAYRGFIMLLLVSSGFGLAVLKEHCPHQW